MVDASQLLLVACSCSETKGWYPDMHVAWTAHSCMPLLVPSSRPVDQVETGCIGFLLQDCSMYMSGRTPVKHGFTARHDAGAFVLHAVCCVPVIFPTSLHLYAPTLLSLRS